MKAPALLSMMAGYMDIPSSLTPLKWLGMLINFFISGKYFALISSNAGLNCSLSCLCVHKKTKTTIRILDYFTKLFGLPKMPMAPNAESIRWSKLNAL